MKRILVLLGVLVLSLSLVGCGAAKPDATVAAFFTSAQQFDTEGMAATILPENEEDIAFLNFDPDVEEDEYAQYFIDYFAANAEKITYTITDSQVEEDQAVVTVECTYIDGEPMINNVLEEYIVRSFEIAFSGQSFTKEDAADLFIEVLDEYTLTAEEVYTTETFDVSCINQEGVWYIEEVTTDMLDVVTSNFMTAIYNFAADFEE